jgi:hypothetical protein
MSRSINHEKNNRRNQVVRMSFDNISSSQVMKTLSAGRKRLTKAELAEQLAAAVRATAEMGRGK